MPLATGRRQKGGLVPEAEATQRARQYRVRAEELRTISESWVSTETRRILGRVAADYERMAAHLEKRRRNEPAQLNP